MTRDSSVSQPSSAWLYLFSRLLRSTGCTCTLVQRPSLLTSHKIPCPKYIPLNRSLNLSLFVEIKMVQATDQLSLPGSTCNRGVEGRIQDHLGLLARILVSERRN
jgi:hypothetical protein